MKIHGIRHLRNKELKLAKQNVGWLHNKNEITEKEDTLKSVINKPNLNFHITVEEKPKHGTEKGSSSLNKTEQSVGFSTPEQAEHATINIPGIIYQDGKDVHSVSTTPEYEHTTQNIRNDVSKDKPDAHIITATSEITEYATETPPSNEGPFQYTVLTTPRQAVQTTQNVPVISQHISSTERYTPQQINHTTDVATFNISQDILKSDLDPGLTTPEQAQDTTQNIPVYGIKNNNASYTTLSSTSEQTQQSTENTSVSQDMISEAEMERISTTPEIAEYTSTTENISRKKSSDMFSTDAYKSIRSTLDTTHITNSIPVTVSQNMLSEGITSEGNKLVTGKIPGNISQEINITDYQASTKELPVNHTIKGVSFNESITHSTISNMGEATEDNLPVNGSQTGNDTKIYSSTTIPGLNDHSLRNNSNESYPVTDLNTSTAKPEPTAEITQSLSFSTGKSQSYTRSEINTFISATSANAEQTTEALLISSTTELYETEPVKVTDHLRQYKKTTKITTTQRPKIKTIQHMYTRKLPVLPT